MTKNTKANMRLPKYNHEDKAIEITKAFAKRASVFGTEEFKLLQQYREYYKDYEVRVTTTMAKRTKKNNLKGLSYDFMKQYIERHDTEDQSIMEEFNKKTVKNEDNIATKSYGEVKKWFLEQYPEIAKAA